MPQIERSNRMPIRLTARRVLLLVLCLAASDAFGTEPPVIVAHRGLLRHAPENTLANFRACMELRIGFEFDVLKTKDNELVCIHDDTLDRTTNGTSRVSELTFDDIWQLDAGSWFDPNFAGEKVPTVEEVLKLIAEYAQHEVLIAVDLKAESVEQGVVSLAEKHGVIHRLLFIGRAISEPNVREQIEELERSENWPSLRERQSAVICPIIGGVLPSWHRTAEARSFPLAECSTTLLPSPSPLVDQSPNLTQLC